MEELLWRCKWTCFLIVIYFFLVKDLTFSYNFLYFYLYFTPNLLLNINLYKSDEGHLKLLNLGILLGASYFPFNFNDCFDYSLLSTFWLGTYLLIICFSLIIYYWLFENCFLCNVYCSDWTCFWRGDTLLPRSMLFRPLSRAFSFLQGLYR